MGATARTPRKTPRTPPVAQPVRLSVRPAPQATAPWVQSARVDHVLDHNRVAVTVDGDTTVEAQVAVAGGYVPLTGDTVLVTTDAHGVRYVVGVVTAPRPVTDPVRVTDPDGALVFEYFAHERRSVVYAPAGDLEFRADHGHIALSAADGVRLHGGRTDDTALPGSKLTVDVRGVSVMAPTLDARAVRVEVSAQEARLVARSVSTAAETMRHVVGVIETQATRVVSRVKNAYHEVEELSQTRAGRMRLVAETTFHLLSGRALVKAEQDIKLKGEKIHLG